jgi:predicted permease
LIDLGRSRLFQQTIVGIYWIVLPLLLVVAVGAALSPEMPGRWLVAVGLLVGSAFTGWRLWLYRRALGVATAAPPARLIAFVWLPLGLLAFAGFIIILTGLVWIAVPLMLMSDPVANNALGGWGGGGMIASLGVIVIAIGIGLTAPFVLALRRKRAAQLRVAGSPADDDQQGEDAPVA